MKLKAIYLRDLLSKPLAKGDYKETRKTKLEQLEAPGVYFNVQGA